MVSQNIILIIIFPVFREESEQKQLKEQQGNSLKNSIQSKSNLII